MVNKANEIILYGAVAKNPDPPQALPRYILRLKRQIFELRDYFVLRAGKTSTLDYRNFDNPAAANIGDIAIAYAIRLLLRQHLADGVIECVNWGDNLYLASERATSTAPGPLFLFGGSGYIALAKDNALPSRLRADMDFLVNRRLRSIMLGIGVNCPGRDHLTPMAQELLPADESLLRVLLENTNGISVRDLFSQQLLQRYTSQTVHLTGDPALFTHPLSPDDDSRSKRTAGRLRIGINFSFHGPNSNSIIRKNLSAYISLLKEIQKRTDCELYYFVHYDAEMLLPRIFRRAGVSMKVVNASPDVLCEIYADLDAHIGSMLHSCILAFSAGTPAIALAYDTKHSGLFELMEMPEFCLSAIHFDSDLVLARLQSILDNPWPVRETIRRRRMDLEQRTHDFLARYLDE